MKTPHIQSMYCNCIDNFFHNVKAEERLEEERAQMKREKETIITQLQQEKEAVLKRANEEKDELASKLERERANLVNEIALIQKERDEQLLMAENEKQEELHVAANEKSTLFEKLKSHEESLAATNIENDRLKRESFTRAEQDKVRTV
jgi:cation transport regulator ChaC